MLIESVVALCKRWGPALISGCITGWIICEFISGGVRAISLRSGEVATAIATDSYEDHEIADNGSDVGSAATEYSFVANDGNTYTGSADGSAETKGTEILVAYLARNPSVNDSLDNAMRWPRTNAGVGVIVLGFLSGLITLGLAKGDQSKERRKGTSSRSPSYNGRMNRLQTTAQKVIASLAVLSWALILVVRPVGHPATYGRTTGQRYLLIGQDLSGLVVDYSQMWLEFWIVTAILGAAFWLASGAPYNPRSNSDSYSDY